jgi:hypothetical protein
MFQEQVTEIGSRLCGLSFKCFEIVGILNYMYCEPNTVLFIIFTLTRWTLHLPDIISKFGIPTMFLMVSNFKCDSN